MAKQLNNLKLAKKFNKFTWILKANCNQFSPQNAKQ